MGVRHTLAGNDEAVDANDRLCTVRSIKDDGAVDRLSRRGSALLAGAERNMIHLFVSLSLGWCKNVLFLVF